MSATVLSRKRGHDLVGTYVYGPVRSRRLGMSLGINWFAPWIKVCNFDCLYCQLGRTERLPRREDFVRVDVFAREVMRVFAELAERNVRVDAITISGNGEPTLHPRTPELIAILLEARDRFFPGARTWILTNGTRLHVDGIARAVNRLDERSVKLDGVGADLITVDRPRFGFRWTHFIEGLRKLRDFHLQVMVLAGRGKNIRPDALAAWTSWIRQQALVPKSIQLYTVDRYPAYPGVRPLTRTEMEAVVQYIAAELPDIPLDVVWPGAATSTGE